MEPAIQGGCVHPFSIILISPTVSKRIAPQAYAASRQPPFGKSRLSPESGGRSPMCGPCTALSLSEPQFLPERWQDSWAPHPHLPPSPARQVRMGSCF